MRRKETIAAGAAVAYTLFLFDAAGMKFVLLSTVLLAPATLLYVKARSEHGRRLFTPAEIGLFVLIVGRRRHRRRRPLDRPHHHLKTGIKERHYDASPRRTASTPRSAGCARCWSAHPGLAHRRLTPSNNDELLFDDVMWVENAQRDHADFANKLTQRGVEVVELHDLLAQTLEVAGRAGLAAGPQDRAQPGRPRAGRRHPRPTSSRCRRETLAEFLIGGLATNDLPDDFRSDYVDLARESTGAREYLMPPLPNTLYTRDTTCWLYGGLTMNPLYWPARKDETLIYKAIYQFHPDYVGSKIWWGDPEQDWGQASFEGGDVMPVGNGVVLVGHERAHLAPGDHPGRQGAVRPGRRRPG